MIAVEPGLGEVLELVVGGYLLGWQMAVVVYHRHFPGVVMVEPAGGLGVEEKVLI
jgi:hypothetical protein